MRLLRRMFYAAYLILLCMAVLLEFVFPIGEFGIDGGEGDSMATWEYLSEIIGIGGTLVLVPLSLKFMALKPVRRSLLDGGKSSSSGYLRWSIFRLVLLCAVMGVNLIFYYLWLSSTFGCCALIGFIASLFCWPSEDRMEQETGRHTDNGELNERGE